MKIEKKNFKDKYYGGKGKKNKNTKYWGKLFLKK